MKEKEDDYTIKLNVSNTFDSESGVNIKVMYYKKDNGNPDVKKISPGHKKEFQLKTGDEYLEILLDSESELPTTYPYPITAGKQAQAKCEFDGEPKEPENALFGAQYHEEDFYVGGEWKVEEKDKDKIWKLTIKEYEFDPQTDDVVIGSGPPA